MRVFRYMGFNPSEEVFIVVAQEWGGWGAGCGGTCSWVSYPPPPTHTETYIHSAISTPIAVKTCLSICLCIMLQYICSLTGFREFLLYHFVVHLYSFVSRSQYGVFNCIQAPCSREENTAHLKALAEM